MEGFGKRVVTDLESRHVFVLIRRDSDELSGGESKSLHQLLPVVDTTLVDFDDVDPGLVLVQAVEHNLALGADLVGQLDPLEAHRILGPMAPIVGRVGVSVQGSLWRRLRFTT